MTASKKPPPRKKKPKRYVPYDHERHKNEWGDLYWPLALCWMAAGVSLVAAALAVLLVVYSVLV